ncbi:hypothetical protein FRC17_004112 [Serendipita sp. 399]|nr:hypothetical protein FRC17_004112 [Serendipita sp. 399]
MSSRDLASTNNLDSNALLGSLRASGNRIPSDIERVRLESILDIHSTASKSLDEAIASTGKTLTDARRRLQQLKAEVEGVQAEIRSSRQMMDILKSQKSALSDAVQEIRGLLHPIRKLPQEILVMIFAIVADAEQDGSWHTLKLSQVCRTWRQAAIRHPLLWTSITIALHKPIFQKSNNVLQRAMNMLKVRTGGCAVDLALCSSGKEENDAILEKVKTIFSQLRDIRSLELVFWDTDPSVFQTILSRYAYHLESLRKLDLNSNCMSPKDGFALDLDELLTSRTSGRVSPIENLTIYQVGCVNFGFRFDLPALTFLSVCGVPRLPLLYILIRCPNLQQVVVEDSAEDDSYLSYLDSPFDQKIPHSLRQLSVGDGTVLSVVIEAVNLPHLQRITIESNTPGNIHNIFQDLLALSYLKVPELDLSRLDMLAVAAPNIKIISTRESSLAALLVDWSQTRLAAPPFKTLDTLEIMFLNDSLGVELFDELVERRCLPMGLTQKTRDPETVQIRTMRITYLAQWHPPMFKSWKESKYLEHAKVESRGTLTEIVWPS